MAKISPFLIVLTIAAQLAFLGAKYRRLGQSKIYDAKLVQGQVSNGFEAIFRQLCHTENTIPLFYCELSSKPFQLIIDGPRNGRT